MKKSLLILFGESFRLGGQGSRNIGHQKSYESQIKATQSQILFIKFLKHKNINMKVSINSYDTKFKNNLLNCFVSHDLVENYFFFDKLIGQENLIKHSISKIKEINSYDFILIMRIDLFLKPRFNKIFNPKSDKILFPSICFIPYHKVFNYPRVNDMMMFIPKKYFKIINNFNLNHRTWFNLIKMYKLTNEDLDTMLETYHDSDSAKDFNPIYFIVNRFIKPPPNKCGNIKFNKYNFI